LKTYQIYINGEWINSNSNKSFSSLNPANEQVIGYFQSCNKQDVDSIKEALKIK